jgi:hypothetical protein
MPRPLLMVLARAWCTRTGGHDVTPKDREAWRVGLTDEQAPDRELLAVVMPISKEISSPSPIGLVLAVARCYTLLVLKGVRPARAALACGHLLRL